MIPAVALESTLLLHGVPRSQSLALAERLFGIIKQEGAEPRLIAVLGGRRSSHTSLEDLARLLALPSDQVPKVNTSNLGLALHRGLNAATTVSSTMELAAAEGIHYFATGGLGGVHPLEVKNGFLEFDVSSDLTAFTRFPVAVVCSGVKSILDVASTRESLEALGVPVVGYQTDEFPAFYFRAEPSGNKLYVDARFDDARKLSDFVTFELNRTGRGILIANPIAKDAEIAPRDWEGWLKDAEALPEVSTSTGRAKTPALLAALHRISHGRTLAANVRLIAENARLAAELAVQGR